MRMPPPFQPSPLHNITNHLDSFLANPCSFPIAFTASQPYMNWWMDICQSVYGGGIFCALIMIGLNFFIIVGTNNAGSRLAWSMARDKAFPYSEYFAHVSTRFHIPLRAMIAILVVDLIIGEFFFSVVLLVFFANRALTCFARTFPKFTDHDSLFSPFL